MYQPSDPPASPTPPSITAVTPPTRPRAALSMALLITLCAGLIPETVATSSTSPLKILVNPLSLFFIAAFYGTAVLLIREARIRRHLRWGSVILLGIAFGFVNEGVLAGTWYTVKPTGYYFFDSVDIAWAVSLTVFHTFVSIVIPMVFADLLFPRLAGKSLLGRGGMIICGVIFGVITLLVIAIPAYRPFRLTALLAAILLTALALVLPPALPRLRSSMASPGLWRLRVAGFVAMFSYFLLIYLLPAVTAAIAGPRLAIAQGVDITVLLLFATLVTRQGWRWSGRAGWSLHHDLALITGALTFTTLVSILPSNLAFGEPVVTLPFFVLLVVLQRRLRRISPREIALSGQAKDTNHNSEKDKG